jgi:hypothetical protein
MNPRNARPARFPAHYRWQVARLARGRLVISRSGLFRSVRGGEPPGCCAQSLADLEDRVIGHWKGSGGLSRLQRHRAWPCQPPRPRAAPHRYSPILLGK